MEAGAPPATVDNAQAELPVTKLRRNLILFILCSSQFFDIFNASAAILSLPELGADLDFTPGSLQWILSVYTLTFAAFMLASGRLADITHPKPIFCVGYAILGLFSIPVAASVDPIMSIVFRAIQGIGAAMNVPSAISLLVTYFPDPAEQGRALAIFGASGSIGNIIGFIVSGALSARASWRWVYYLITILVVPFSVLGWFVLPKHHYPEARERRSVDWLGTTTLTAALILLVFALSDSRWGTARVIVTLVLAVVLIVAFFVIEKFVKDPAVPPRTWTNKNFIPLFFYAWSIYWFAFGMELNLVQIFQDLWRTSAISAAIRCFPLGITAGISAILTGIFAPKIPRRILLIGGQVLMAASVVLFAFADRPSKYWSHMLPAMILGMTGVSVAYVGNTIAVMESARPIDQGVVGAIMYTAYQVGSTIGVAGE
ncbi:MFS general substrate transporter [Marasmius fiardii PR-910]|nr:MFS general substrate transporter [Marasmius fiardii PR-910]